MDLHTTCAFLGRPEAYADDTTSVEAIETHMSWVFLTAHHAFKLKKPVRHPALDYTSIERRRWFCHEEVRLNRRLAASVYLAAVPLTVEHGRLAIDGRGEVVDWLVKMRRLPAERMLPSVIARAALSPADLDAVAALLTDFYRRAERAPWDGRAYLRQLGEVVASTARELTALELDGDRVGAVADAQRSFLAGEAAVVAARADQGHVVDAHGDLRPEHICLEDPPVIIDCLEFDPELRWLDAASELSFLALECDRLGASWVGAGIAARYRAASGDRPAPRLAAFYRSLHAAIRALIAVRHVEDALPSERGHWRSKADDYLGHAAACALTVAA